MQLSNQSLAASPAMPALAATPALPLAPPRQRRLSAWPFPAALDRRPAADMTANARRMIATTALHFMAADDAGK